MSWCLWHLMVEWCLDACDSWSINDSIQALFTCFSSEMFIFRFLNSWSLQINFIGKIFSRNDAYISVANSSLAGWRWLHVFAALESENTRVHVCGVRCSLFEKMEMAGSPCRTLRVSVKLCRINTSKNITPLKTNMVSWKSNGSMVGKCKSYRNSPFLGDMSVFGGEGTTSAIDVWFLFKDKKGIRGKGYGCSPKMPILLFFILCKSELLSSQRIHSQIINSLIWFRK